MIEAASLLAAYFSFALLHAARPERTPFRVPLGLPARSATARVLSLVSLSLSAWLWSRTEAGPAAILVAVTALMVAASLFVLLAPVWPRAVWTLAALCPPIIAALSLTGGCGG